MLKKDEHDPNRRMPAHPTMNSSSSLSHTTASVLGWGSSYSSPGGASQLACAALEDRSGCKLTERHRRGERGITDRVWECSCVAFNRLKEAQDAEGTFRCSLCGDGAKAEIKTTAAASHSVRRLPGFSCLRSYLLRQRRRSQLSR